MRAGSMKVAISLPRQAFEEVETFRHQLGFGRSQAILEAIRCWLREQHERLLEESYTKGYKRKPESSESSEPLFLAGLSGFSKESWQ